MVKVEKISSYKVKHMVYEEYHISHLNRGLGHTIGNSLRRTIIGFTPGIAIFGIKFSCFQHEFDNCNSILEDANEILERFKNVIIAYDETFFEDVLEVNIDVKGPIVFKAGLIKSDKFKIINTDFVLFNVIKEFELNIVLLVKRGIGFVVCKDNNNILNNNEFLGVTSVYSKINNVTYLLMDKNTSFHDYDEIVVFIEHESVYPVGFVFKNSIKTIVFNMQELSSSYDDYQSDKCSSSVIRTGILNIIEEKYGTDVVNFFSTLTFINYQELDLLLSKLTYKKCKLLKNDFHDLCNLIKSKIVNET